jgi:transcriptional regulator with XRE-family HTH domain
MTFDKQTQHPQELEIAMPRGKESRITDPSGFAQRFNGAYMASTLTPKELVNGVCAPSYISQTRKGKRFPSDHILRQLASRLNVTPSWLITGEDSLEDRLMAAFARLAPVSDEEIEQAIWHVCQIRLP